MATLVKIIIKGVAICYKKNNLWKVLFPFDDCHTVKLNYEHGAEKGFLGNFGRTKCKIEVTTNQTLVPPSSSGQFDEEILNLTSDSSNNTGKTFPYITHQAVKAKEGWNTRGVLLTMQNTNLDVNDSLKEDFSDSLQGYDIYLTDKNTDKRIDFNQAGIEIAHSIEGKIGLDGENIITVKVDNTEIFTTVPGGTYIFTFNNDCEGKPKPPKTNDMEMFYEVIEDANPQANRKFVIEGRPNGQVVNRSIPPNFADGKPCLAVEVTKVEGLP